MLVLSLEDVLLRKVKEDAPITTEHNILKGYILIVFF